MSMVDTIGRIQQIQSALTALSTPVEPAKPAAPAAPEAANASVFADALTAATGTPPPATGLGGLEAHGGLGGLEAAAGLSGLEAAAGLSGLEAATGAVAVTSPAPAAGSDAGTAVEAAAKKYLGLPYIWGGNDPAVGLDCSSFVQNVFKDLGYQLPRTTWDQINEGTPVASMSDAKPGDLLFTFDTGHVSIYLGNGKAVDAPQPGQTIEIRDLWENDSNVTAIRRIIPDGAGT
jgi:cell wall-associated NlpC family hydrolase